MQESTVRKKMTAVHFQYLANQTKPTGHIEIKTWFDGSRSYTNSIALVEFE